MEFRTMVVESIKLLGIMWIAMALNPDWLTVQQTIIMTVIIMKMLVLFAVEHLVRINGQ